MRARRIAIAVAASLLCTSGAALAFVPYRTPAGQAFHWPRACVAMRVYVDDLPDMTPDQIMTAARGAAAAWSATANPCSFVNLVVERASGPGPKVAYDNVNAITFRRTSWCGPNDPPGACTYDQFATAISSIFAAKTTGEIRDADIEVNAKNFLWADIELQPGAKEDLQSVLTHEMGHVLGFDHSCAFSVVGGPPLDDMGAPAPACDTASAAVRATTMFPSSPPNDITKRTLAPDDQRAVCETYPAADAGAPGADAGLPTFAACAAPVDGGADDADSGSGGDGGDDGATAAVPDARAEGGGDGAPVAVADAQPHGERGDDAGPTPLASGGCGCAVGESGGARGPFIVVLALVLVATRRRRR